MLLFILSEDVYSLNVRRILPLIYMTSSVSFNLYHDHDFGPRGLMTTSYQRFDDENYNDLIVVSFIIKNEETSDPKIP